METQKNINKLLKQSSALGSWWGNFQNVATHCNIYLQFMIFSFSGVSAYGVLLQRGYNIPFWVFLVLTFSGIAAMALFVWKFTMHSTFSAWNYQWWEHDNPMRKEVEEIKKELAEIKKLIKEQR